MEREKRPVTADSVTHLGSAARGSVVACGSHGGRYSAAVALAAGVAGIVFNDASGGLDGAGVAGLALLAEHGIPAAAVDVRTAGIGRATETLRRGVISHLNDPALAAGCAVGQPAAEALERIAAAPTRTSGAASLPVVRESRSRLLGGPLEIWALDSASLVRPTDTGTVVVTGSHGQLVGDDPAAALGVDARIAVFNDAGGVIAPSRLEALDERGIPAVTVAAASARIGDARSSYFDGVISAVNDSAAADGAVAQQTARAYVTSVVERTTEAIR